MALSANDRLTFMARLTKDRSLEPIIDAAQTWIQSCLINDRSILSTEGLWTLDNVEQVASAYIDHPDIGNDDFLATLRGQMSSASQSAKRLMAEMVWAIQLFPSNIGALKKRKQVAQIWEMAGESLRQERKSLSDDILVGIGSGGPGFLKNRWREIVFLISLVRDLKNRTPEERKRILTEYDAFIDWIERVPRDGERQFRHMLRFFCFPDRVERMSSTGDRCAVLVGFGITTSKDVKKWSDQELDEALLKLRRQEEAKHSGEILDFYESPLSEVWKSVDDERTGKPPVLSNEKSARKIQDLVKAFESDAKESLLHVNQSILHRLATSLLSKRFLIATGLAGSGKTKLAHAFARWITPPHSITDVFSPGSIIPSANVSYFVKKSDSLSVEFWNAPNEEDATKVSLPREMIAEWAAYVKEHSIPQTVQAREIREAVKKTSRFSDQLHSFETHLKAAAFALLKSQVRDDRGSCYALIPVGADWTGNENILGYPDGLQENNYITKPALDLILHAADHAEVPHFLILDEMNLSHVERYFSDILSIIETDEGLELYAGDMRKPETWRTTRAAKPVPPKLKQLPENLFIIGTVNVDETTYMFSPKVLDRANVIEFRMGADELEGFLGNPAKPDLSKVDGKGTAFGKAFVDAAKNPVMVPSDVKAAYDAEMLLLFKTLQSHGSEFGFRTAYETARFVHFYDMLGDHLDGDGAWFPSAFDCVVFQKLLPKLHGSRAKLGPVLKKLWFLCVNEPAIRGEEALKSAEEAARSTDKKAEPSVIVPTGAPYPLSAEKIGRMWRLLVENGFASFAEA